ncbi:uncharacterized protein NFIA_112290 [Aspergillus fischeri NRRL 181]|uniref:BTB domain-containing protein n=1 Tax=Neosartorya fischeri (strain ATCC 1020 / DSM 3700 / CBS 544.65 / FGSC A1164 / JCM 1740 / NRRL 181 / WB 181) TaxID=331117 RepID=A1D8J4_NEOFI|nr:uncharacterized protein NFIA_112290 [Aspergillus fischeri NRRL 181]EAW20705.1 hypothetical protein NFIA_112290 [Aspergillus fischeri NRRL 181]
MADYKEAVVKNNSDPLYALISNGHMKESNTGNATLEDVEVETFIGFCEYAYTGAYVTPDCTLSQEAEGRHLGPLVDEGEEPSFNHVTCLAQDEPLDAAATIADAPDPWDPWNPPVVRKEDKKKKKKNSWDSEANDGPPPAQITVIYPYERLWEEFRSLKFRSEPASSSSDPDILFHAKLYVFATKYLIKPLRKQCLKSIHRDLCDFSLNRESTSVILDLLDFTYMHTGRGEPGGKSLLRDLVIHYAACEARTLADDENFVILLDSNGEMGSDLAMKLVR